MARILTSILLAVALAAPQAFADNHRTSGNRNSNRREQPAAVHRPSSGKQNGNKHNARPAEKPNKNHDFSNGNRHNNNKHNFDNKKHNNDNKKPDYNRPANHRPDNGYNRPSSDNRHHNNFGPVSDNRHNNYRPVNNPGNHFGNNQHHFPPMVKPPHRPNRPVPGPWHRPVRPRGWRPAPNAPLLSTMLGVAFGTAINLAINQLINNGYNVSGYNSNTVFLTDVNQAGYFWPDATFYYDGGCLDRSQFYYTSPYNDNGRYVALYNSFTSRYGYPVNVVNSPSNMSATWFAPNRGYITLQYGIGAPMSLPGRFVTTLTVGI